MGRVDREREDHVRIGGQAEASLGLRQKGAVGVAKPRDLPAARNRDLVPLAVVEPRGREAIAELVDRRGQPECPEPVEAHDVGVRVRRGAWWQPTRSGGERRQVGHRVRERSAAWRCSFRQGSPMQRRSVDAHQEWTILRSAWTFRRGREPLPAHRSRGIHEPHALCPKSCRTLPGGSSSGTCARRSRTASAAACSANP